MPDMHARLSASGASKWINCPGSVVLEDNFENTSSEYAEEGTLAHSVAELKLQKYFIKGIGPKKFKRLLDEFKQSEYWNNEMDRYTDIYFDEIKRRSLAYESKPYVNIEERVDFSRWVPDGFGTADCIMIYGDELQVIDLKYGKGVSVSPEHNPQLMLYGLGAYNAYSMFYDINNIKLTIIQPRLDSIIDWEISTDDLLKFGESIIPIAKEASEGSNKLKVGEHCRFCRAKSKCPERAKTMFSKVTILKKASDKDVALLSNMDIANYLNQSKGLIDWLKDLEDEALKVILNGEEIPGYKAVEGKSIRTFKNQEDAFNILKNNNFNEEVLYEKKPLSLAKIENLVGKTMFNDLLKDQVIKPQGKPTLVEASDKREPFIPDCGFKVLN